MPLAPSWHSVIACVALILMPALSAQQGIPLPSRPLDNPHRGLVSSSSGTFDIDARIRQHWQELRRICPQQYYSSCNGLDRSNWTDVSKTKLSDFRFNGLGTWSTFKVATFDHAGMRKHNGGDTWYIRLRESDHRVSALPVRVFDEGDGTYLAAAYILVPGNYSIAAHLYYSDCRGFQEPAYSIGYYETQPLQQEDHCFIGTTMHRPGFGVIDIPPSDRLPPCLRHSCSMQHSGSITDAAGTAGRTWRVETYSYKVNHTWHTRHCCRAPVPAAIAAQPVTRFLMYGDSTLRNQWDLLLALARRPCKIDHQPHVVHDMFQPDSHVLTCFPMSSVSDVDPVLDPILQRCTGGVPWTTVPIGTNAADIDRFRPMSYLVDMEHFVYNDTYVRKHYPPVPLPLPREFSFIYIDGHSCRTLEIIEADLAHVRPGDLLVINVGSHCSRSLSFADWQERVLGIGKLLSRIMQRSHVPVYWRTSFMYREPNFRQGAGQTYFPALHFQTDARRLLFDSYAEHVLVPLGVHIWDVYGMSSMGDYQVHDMVHVDSHTSWAMNMDMMDLIVCH